MGQQEGWKDTPKPSPYGYCPICREPGALRERRPNGNDQCGNLHVYPSKDAVAAKIGVGSVGIASFSQSGVGYTRRYEGIAVVIGIVEDGFNVRLGDGTIVQISRNEFEAKDPEFFDRRR